MQNGKQMRLTSDELKLIKATFFDNEPLVRLLRKLFLPEYDPNAPVGQTVDLWTIKDPASMSPEECQVYFWTRRDLILHVESQLLQIESLSKMKLETEEEAEARKQKDSTK